MSKAAALALAIGAVLGCADAHGPTPSLEDPPIRGVLGNRSLGPLTDTVLGTMTEFEQPLRVLVLDPNGEPMPGVVVTWTASGGGLVSSTTTVTDAGGESFVEYTFGREARAGYGATASVPGLIGSPLVWDLRAHPGRPVALTKQSGDGHVVEAGGRVVFTVIARDSYGNGTQGVWIDWVPTSGGGSLSQSRSVTGKGGRAEVTRTLGGMPGDQTTTAIATTIPGAPRVTFVTHAVGAATVFPP